MINHLMFKLIILVGFTTSYDGCYASSREEYYEKAEDLKKSGKYREAEKYYHVSAEKGHPQAQYNLGLIYYNNDQDFVNAKKYFQLAAKQGIKEALNKLEDKNMRDVPEDSREKAPVIKYNKNVGHYFETKVDPSLSNLNTKGFNEDDY